MLKIQGGKLETIPRDQVEQIKTAEVSLMPEEIEKQLSPQEIADLFAFLCLDKPPVGPGGQAAARRGADRAAIAISRWQGSGGRVPLNEQ